MSKELKEKVEEINIKFYEALNNMDINSMDEIWLKDSSVKCVHPGWPIIKGWDAVRSSWENIFESVDLTTLRSQIYL